MVVVFDYFGGAKIARFMLRWAMNAGRYLGTQLESLKWQWVPAQALGALLAGLQG